MSGTFKLDQTFWPVDPIAKRWRRQSVGVGGDGSPIFADYWIFEVDFGILTENSEELSYFFDRWHAAARLHTACFPHPRDGTMTGFTGVAFDEFSYEFTDVEQNTYGEGARAVFSHISLAATGSCADC